MKSQKIILIAVVATVGMFFGMLTSAQLTITIPKITSGVAQQQKQQEIQNLLQKINQINDINKRYLATKIVNEMDFTNTTATDHFNNVLDQLDNVVQLIQSRSLKAASNGKDVSDVNDAVQKAEQSIETARSTVEQQSEKTYIVDITLLPKITSTQAGQNKMVSVLKTQFGINNTQLKTDISSIENGVMKNARGDTRNAFLVLAEVPEVDNQPSLK